MRSFFDWALLLNVRTIAQGPVEETIVAEHLRRAYGATAAAETTDGLEELAWAR